MFLAAYKHYWIPTLSSSIYGSYLKVNNSIGALNANAGGAFGAVNYAEVRTGTNLIWTPVKGFDIGGEFFYSRQTYRPVDQFLWVAGPTDQSADPEVPVDAEHLRGPAPRSARLLTNGTSDDMNPELFYAELPL